MNATANTIPQITFAEFLVSGFYLEDTGGSTVRGVHAVNGKSVETEFTAEQVNTLDPRLFGTIQIMFTQLHSKASRLGANWLSDTLEYWNNPLYLSEFMGTPLPMAEIDKLHKYNTENKTITVIGYMFNEHEAEGVKFAAGKRWVEFRVSWAEFEKHFPGWKVRYDLLSSLSTTDDELVKAVCQRPAEPLNTMVTLPEVNFE